jgi:hypothetical protein
MSFAKYPVSGSGTGVRTVADAAERNLLTATDGMLVVQLDTDELYEYNGSTWAVIGDRTYNDPIVNADISASAAIDRSKLASGTADHVVINNASGVMSSEATLAKSRGGTGADNTAVTFPSTGTIVTEAGAQALTNKTFDADLNTVSNIDNGDIKAGAAIDRTKLASGTLDHVLINNGSGVMSSEAQLSKARGGTGADNTAVTFPATGTIVTEAGSQALTNKTFDADLNTVSNIEDGDIKVGANISRSKLASGTASHVIINDGSGVLSSEATLAKTRGGTAADNTNVTFPSTGVIATRDATETLLNKTVVSSTDAITGALTLPSGTTADRSGLNTTGMVRHNTSSSEFEGYTNGAWQPIGSGLNEQPVKNYLKTYALATIAPGTLSTLASTTANLVSLTAFYADSTSGSSALTNPTDSTLRGTTNYLTATGTSEATGARFVQFPAFALDGTDLGKPVSLSFDVSGVTTDGNWDVVVVRYNSSGVHQEIISVAGNASSGTTPVSAKLPTGTTTFNGFFIPTADVGHLYAVRLRSLANTVQIRVDTLFVGNQPVRTGTVVTDWQSYTPTGPYTTGSPVYTGRWRRVGDSIEVSIDIAFSTTTNAAGAIFTPAQVLNGLGLTIDTSKLPNITDAVTPIGNWNVYDSGIAIYGGVVCFPGTNIELYAATGSNISAANPIAINTGDNMSFNARLPITGWSTNVTMADRAVEEFAADDGSADVFGVNGAPVPNVGFGTGFTSRNFSFQGVRQATDSFDLEYFYNGFGWSKQNGLYNCIIGTGGYAFGIRGYWTSATTYTVEFGNGGTASNNGLGAAGSDSWASRFSGGDRWRLRRVSGGAQVGYPINSANIVGRVDGNAPASGYVGEVKTFTSRSVTVSGTGVWYSNVSSVVDLTAGTWAIYPVASSPFINATNATGVAGLATSSTGGTGLIIQTQHQCYSTHSTSATVTMQPTIVTISSATSYYAQWYAYNSTPGTSPSISGVAVRIA